MNEITCPQFDNCSAPLCPLQPNTIDGGIWYPGEEICNRRGFQNLDWAKKQKLIVKAKAPLDKYFTVEMLKAIKQVRKGIEGINPDQSLEQAEEAERKWIAEKKGGRVIANQNQKPRQVIAKKKDNLVFAGETSHQSKGGQK